MAKLTKFLWVGFENNLLMTKMFNAHTHIYRDANFYGLPVVTTENCKNFQFSTDYGKLEFYYGDFFLKYLLEMLPEKC